MSVQIVARRYSTALADVALEKKEATEVQRELSAWEQMIAASPALQEIIRNPTIAFDQKQALLKSLIQRTRPRQTTANFLNVLLHNQRLTDLAEINRRFTEVLDERAGMVAARVTTARPVAESSQRALHTTLSALTKRKVRIDFQTDPDLIGGLVTRIGSTVYDGSVRNQLQRIKEKMAG